MFESRFQGPPPCHEPLTTLNVSRSLTRCLVTVNVDYDCRRSDR